MVETKLLMRQHCICTSNHRIYTAYKPPTAHQILSTVSLFYKSPRSIDYEIVMPYPLLERHNLSIIGSVSAARKSGHQEDFITHKSATEDDFKAKVNGLSSSGVPIGSDFTQRVDLCSYCTEMLILARAEDAIDEKSSFQHYALLVDLKDSSATCPICDALLQTFDSADIEAAVVPTTENPVWTKRPNDARYDLLFYGLQVRGIVVQNIYRGIKPTNPENPEEYCTGRALIFCTEDGGSQFEAFSLSWNTKADQG